MAPPLRVLLALCAPYTIVAFVRPGALFGAPRQSIPSSATGSGRWATTPGARRANDGTQERRRERPSASGPLFAKTLEYEVTYKPAANSSVILVLDLPGETTQLCYDKAVRQLSKSAGDKIPGFGGAKNVRHPAEVIERHFGVEEVKGEALKVVSDDVIQKVIEGVDFKAIGSAELVQDAKVLLNMFTPGSPIMLEVKVDVWPEVKMTGEYTGFDLEIEEPVKDEPRINAAWKALQDRNVMLEDTEEGYAAQLGDSVIANMEPYRENKDGSRGEKLPEIASGDNVEIVLEVGRYMPGLAEGMEGVKAGEKREIKMTFPDRLGPSGGDLEGTKAVFEVEALEVKVQLGEADLVATPGNAAANALLTFSEHAEGALYAAFMDALQTAQGRTKTKRVVPEISEEFAQSIRKGLTLAELTKEVEQAVMEESGNSVKDARNKALEDALLAVADIQVPETLIIEQAREKFAIMMSEFRDQGESDEKIQKMITKENFLKYVEVVRKNTTRGLSLGLLFTNIAEKEGIKFDPREVVDQLDLMRAQAKGEEFDEAVAKDKIEASLERSMVLDFIAERSNIKWLPAKSVEKVEMPPLVG